MLTQTHLKQRGWSPKLIKNHLGDPDQIERNPIYPGKGSPMKLWEEARVAAAEKCQEFLAYQTKRAKASACSKAVAENKRQRLLSEVKIINFHVARWPLPKLMRVAIAEWEQMGAERGEYGRYGSDADEATKNRWAVNYVRHNLVSIGSGQHLPLLRGQTGISQAEAVLENKIYDTIADVYPELASAAFQQVDRLWGRVVVPGSDTLARTTPTDAECPPGSSNVGQALPQASPQAALALFLERTHLLPVTTEAERLTVQRIGQDIFREMLLEFWSRRCAITGLDQPEMLRASHLKPWKACTTDAERLDPFNGLLLSVHWDAAFDCGLVTLGDDGTLLLSEQLTRSALQLLLPHPDAPARVLNVNAAHLPYMRYHRKHVWWHRRQ